jgi:hypothetical protein
MGDRARRHVDASFTWRAKARQVHEVYRWVLGRRSKPDFGLPFPDCDDGNDQEPGIRRADVSGL